MDHRFRQLLQLGAFCIKNFIKGAESIQYISDTPLDLCHYIVSVLKRGTLASSKMSFERICVDPSPSAHGVSITYKLLVLPEIDFFPPFLLKWDQDLGTSF